MKAMRVRPRRRLLIILMALMAGGCANTQLHDDGLRLLDEGRYDEAITKLQEASRLDPTNAGYRIDLLNQSQAYGRALTDAAGTARASGNVALAAELFTKALKIDPGSDRARRGLVALELDARSNRLLSESRRLASEGNLQEASDRVDAALADNPGNVAAQHQSSIVRDLLEKRRDERVAHAAAQSLMNKPVTLQFRDANLRMVFEGLSRTTGLNVILDRDVRPDLKTTIFVKDAAVGDVVDLILLQTQLEKRSLNANTMFIYPATAAKQKEYQDLQVRTFQIANVDLKYMLSVLKTVLKIKDVTVDERGGTLVMRDTADAIAVAAKVIAAHDVPEPEVMLEVQVLEISHDRLSNLGIQLPNSFSLTTPDIASTFGGLRALSINQFLVPQLSIGFNFRLEDSDANLLASPRIRARNREKARILIGDRVPIITNSVTPIQSGGSVVTGSVQYQDVGLKLEFEPQIYSDQEVGIRINLEVSSIVREIPGPAGSLAYQIGTRNAQTAVRLRDGETQILGGLISTEDRNTSAHLPGIGHLPVVGRLFGNNNGNDKKTEIVLSITPHIVRPPAILDAAVRNVFAGTESSMREHALQLDPLGSAGGQATGEAVPQVPGQRAAPRPPIGVIGRGVPVRTPAGAAPALPDAPLPADGTADPSTTGSTPPRPVPLNPSAPPAPSVAPEVDEPRAPQ